MLYVGDLVKIVKLGNPNFGELGRVKELRSAIDDEWALVQTKDDEDYYRISELAMEQRHIPVEGTLMRGQADEHIKE